MKGFAFGMHTIKHWKLARMSDIVDPTGANDGQVYTADGAGGAAFVDSTGGSRLLVELKMKQCGDDVSLVPIDTSLSHLKGEWTPTVEFDPNNYWNNNAFDVPETGVYVFELEEVAAVLHGTVSNDSGTRAEICLVVDGVLKYRLVAPSDRLDLDEPLTVFCDTYFPCVVAAIKLTAGESVKFATAHTYLNTGCTLHTLYKKAHGVSGSTGRYSNLDRPIRIYKRG